MPIPYLNNHEPPRQSDETNATPEKEYSPSGEQKKVVDPREKAHGPLIPAVEEINPQASLKLKSKIFFSTKRIVYFLKVIEILFGLRLLMKVFGANPVSIFAAALYFVTGVIAFPFLNLFHPPTITGAETAAYFDWSIFVAGGVYGIAAWVIIQIHKIKKPATKSEIENTVEPRANEKP